VLASSNDAVDGSGHTCGKPQASLAAGAVSSVSSAAGVIRTSKEALDWDEPRQQGRPETRTAVKPLNVCQR
jgi:hypothetical protein